MQLFYTSFYYIVILYSPQDLCTSKAKGFVRKDCPEETRDSQCFWLLDKAQHDNPSLPVQDMEKTQMRKEGQWHMKSKPKHVDTR